MSRFDFSFQSLSGFQVRCNVLKPPVLSSPNSSFNPYRVFKFVATGLDRPAAGAEDNVSIPIGFSSSLQPLYDICASSRIGAVSIPIGFSSSLQHRTRSHSYPRTDVSIPIGFSSSLQRPTSSGTMPIQESFNPYRVFKFVATPLNCSLNFPMQPVSIPIGFSSSLQRSEDRGCAGYIGGVSIPIGFSSSLQRGPVQGI